MKFKDFNNKDSVLVISGWPETTGANQNNYGIAWYTKDTIEPIAKKYGQKFVVLCETNHDNRPKLTVDGKILILRIFDQKHRSLYPRILRSLFAFRKINKVHVHSEFGTNGGIRNFVLLIPFLALIRLTGKKITYFSHNVITDLSGIATHLNYNTGSLKFKILNSGLYFYYKMLGFLCSNIVVMDEEMKRRLVKYVPEKKIISAPFWIKDEKIERKNIARKKLGIPQDKFVLLYFGFITWYKGADWLIKTVGENKFVRKNPNVYLVMAGGEAHSLKDKAYYQKYYAEEKLAARNSKNISLTGFVEEDKIPLYFAAADTVIFPYRGLIGSSGAVAHAITYEKPFVMSRKMKGGLNNSTYQNAIEQAGLTTEQLTFSHTDKSFDKAVKFLSSKENLEKLAKFSKTIKANRSIDVQLSIYWSKIFEEETEPLVRLDEVLINGAYQTAES